MTHLQARRTDFLTMCQAVQQRNMALEEVRDKGANVILSFFRLLKNSLVHTLDNEATTQTASQTHKTITDFSATVGGQVAITFIEHTIFVCGQLLRASRSTYESAMEIGNLLAKCGVSEISYTTKVTIDDLLALADAFSISVRDPQQRDKLLNSKIDHIQIRKANISLIRNTEEDHLPNLQRMLCIYASALMVMRRFLDKTAQGRNVLPHHVKRIAQRLVTLGLIDKGALLAMTTLSNTHRDDAGRAVQSAILSLLIARSIISDRVILGQLSMSALIADVGRARIVGIEKRDQLVELPEQADRNVPSVTSAICIAQGGVNMQSAMRTVTAFETTFIERQKLLGALYHRKKSPFIQAKILYVVRTFLDHLAPRDLRNPLSPPDALAAISRLPNIDQTIYKLLVSVVGLFPTGSVIEFESGEWGIVVGPSSFPDALDKPCIKLITDPSGEVYSSPKQIDLGDPSKAQGLPKIARVIAPDKSHFNITSILMKDSAQKG